MAISRNVGHIVRLQCQRCDNILYDRWGLAPQVFEKLKEYEKERRKARRAERSPRPVSREVPTPSPVPQNVVVADHRDKARSNHDPVKEREYEELEVESTLKQITQKMNSWKLVTDV